MAKENSIPLTARGPSQNSVEAGDPTRGRKLCWRTSAFAQCDELTYARLDMHQSQAGGADLLHSIAAHPFACACDVHLRVRAFTSAMLLPATVALPRYSISARAKPLPGTPMRAASRGVADPADDAENALAALSRIDCGEFPRLLEPFVLLMRIRDGGRRMG